MVASSRTEPRKDIPSGGNDIDEIVETKNAHTSFHFDFDFDFDFHY